MMREVVEHRHAGGFSAELEPPPHATEVRQRLHHLLDRQSGGIADRHGGEGVADVVSAEERDPHRPALLAAHREIERHAVAVGRDVARAPLGVIGEAESLDAAPGERGQPLGLGAVGAENQPAAPRDEADEPPERRAQRLHVGVDVGVVVLEVADDGDVGQILQKLGGLVEERAVVFVALDHEIPAVPQAVAAVEVERDAADQHARVAAAGGQQPARERRSRGLAMRAGDDDRSRAPQELLANHLGHRHEPDLAIEHFFELGIAPRDGVAHDDAVDLRGDVLGGVALERRNAFRLQEIAHRRIHAKVGALHVVATSLEHRRQRAHRGAADADEVEAGHG